MVIIHLRCFHRIKRSLSGMKCRIIYASGTASRRASTHVDMPRLLLRLILVLNSVPAASGLLSQ